MTNYRRTLRSVALSGFLLTLVPAAYAAEPAVTAERLKTLLAGQGMELAWTSLDGTADAFTLRGASVALAGEPQRAQLGDVALTEIAEEDGDIYVGKAVLPGYTISEDGSTVAINGISISGLYLPQDTSGTGPFDGVLLYDRADLETLSVQMAGKEAFSLSGVSVEMEVPEDDSGSLGFTMAAEKFFADLSQVEDAKSKAVIEALGYQTINGYLEAAGSWTPSDGSMMLDQYDLSVEKAGTLGVTFDLGGYTPDFIKAMRDVQAKMANGTEEEKSQQGIAMLGLMQQIVFNGASIRFDDDSLTGKVLDFVASQQGAKPSDIANQAKAVLPFALAQLNNPELAQQITAAVGKFLDAPKSIEIRAEPSAPLPVAAIVATASTAPQSLPQQLGVTVKANED